MWYAHQGDVFIAEAQKDLEISKNAKKIELDSLGGITVVEGEATGHHHRFSNPKVVDAYVLEEFEGNKVIGMNIFENTLLEHRNMLTNDFTGDHGIVPVEKGVKIIFTQREYNSEDEYVAVKD